MCVGGSSPRPQVPVVAPAPTAASVTASADSDTLNRNRKLVAARQGIFGNIRTSATGDSAFGTSSLGGRVAAFGSTKKAA